MQEYKISESQGGAANDGNVVDAPQDFIRST